MILNFCNYSVTRRITIFKCNIAKQVGEDSLIGKYPISVIECTLCVEPQHSCTKDM